MKVVPSLAALPFDFKSWIWLGSLGRARSVLQISNSKTHWFQIWHLLPLDSISGFAWVAWNVPAQYSRWQIPRHIGPDLAPLSFGRHFWICLGSLERARSVLQMVNSKPHCAKSGTAPFWIPFLAVLGQHSIPVVDWFWAQSTT